jgi:hypothetical protein
MLTSDEMVNAVSYIWAVDLVRTGHLPCLLEIKGRPFGRINTVIPSVPFLPLSCEQSPFTLDREALAVNEALGS